MTKHEVLFQRNDQVKSTQGPSNSSVLNPDKGYLFL